MDSVSLTVWVGIVALLSGAAITIIAISPRTREFGAGRKIAGSIAAVLALAILFLPVLFIPALGYGGLVLSAVAVLMVVISAWKWWVLWVPIP